MICLAPPDLRKMHGMNPATPPPDDAADNDLAANTAEPVPATTGPHQQPEKSSQPNTTGPHQGE